MNETSLMEDRTERTLSELKELLDSGDTDRMLLGAGRLLSSILVEFSSRLAVLHVVPSFTADLLLRCILCKTSEYWSAVLELVERGRAHVAISLLRPMFEELVLANFIGQMALADADDFVRRRGLLELLENLIAQERFFPAMRDQFSFSDLQPRVADASFTNHAAGAKAQADALRSMGDRLGWGKRPMPTVRHMAQVTGLEPYHEFIYRASSSAVHASVQRLGRMVWGNSKTGEFTITSSTFEQYFRRFSLVYGGWIASFLASDMSRRFEAEFPEDAKDSLSIIMAFLVKPAVAHEAPSLVTPNELQWTGSA